MIRSFLGKKRTGPQPRTVRINFFQSAGETVAESSLDQRSGDLPVSAGCGQRKKKIIFLDLGQGRKSLGDYTYN
jgi:hypothetical protein